MEQIRAFIESITPMNDADWNIFSSKLEENKFSYIQSESFFSQKNKF